MFWLSVTVMLIICMRAAKGGGGQMGGFPIWTRPSFFLSLFVLFGLVSGPSLFSHYKNRGFRRFFLCSHFEFFLCPIILQFSKNSLFKKWVQKLGFSIFSVLSLNFKNSLFLGVLKHYTNRGFSIILCFLFWRRRKWANKNDNWKFWIWALCPKWPFRDA